MHIVYFTLFYLYFFLIGRGLILFINKMMRKLILNDSSKLFETSILVFYPIIGIFFFSNIAFLFHFFYPLKNFSILLITSGFIFFNLNSSLNLKKNFSIYLITTFNTLILSITAYDINFQYDAGYYHLNYQNWLREFKLVFGLNNLNGAFGTSSIIDYLSASFWFDKNLITLHYLTISFLVFLTTFLSYHIIESTHKYFFYSSFSIVIFGALDNFGKGGGRNGFYTIHGIIKPDIASSVIFYICCIFLTFTLIKKTIDLNELILLNLLIIFSFQLKISSALLFLYFLFTIFKTRIFKFKILFWTNLILIPWIIKNILLTSCIVYPVNITCFNFPWYNEETIIGMRSVTSEFNNSYIIGSSFRNWFKYWISIELNNTIIVNFIISLIILFLIKLLFIKRETYFSKSTILLILIFVLANVFLWITGAAHPRFVYGLFAYIASLVFLNTKEFKEFKINFSYKIIVKCLLIFSILLIPRLNSYKTFFLEPLQPTIIVAPIIEYKKIDENWVMPNEGDQCWINLRCIPYNKKIVETTYFTYKSFNSG